MIAELQIITIVKLGRTILEKGFFSQPLKLANITEDKLAKALRLMVMSSSPGILSGDEYRIDIELKEGSVLHLQTQSYSRIFTMAQMASQTMQVHLQKNTALYYVPHPLVPHKGANFVARNKIYLSENCTLVWGEIITCGRKLNGEAFKFERLRNITEIYLNNRLVVKENLLIKPDGKNLNAIGQLEGFTHQASLFIIKPKNAIRNNIELLHTFLEKEKNITFGVTEAAHNTILVRILGHGAEQLFRCLQEMAELF